MGIPFQCDLCHFRNVAERDPVEGRAKDEYTMMCIRRANLDAAWSREPSTVQSNLYRLQRDYHDAASSLSIKRLVPRLGNTEICDSVGMGIAITTLNASLRKGRYTDHLQWDSMRKSRTWYFNAFEAGVLGDKSALFVGSDRKVYSSTSPTSTPWFSRFLLGAKRRMGVHREQNEALSAEQLTAVLNMCERDWVKSRSEEEKKDIESLASFIIIGFCLSLRGEEVPLVVIEGILQFWDETREHDIPHMMITLRGKFKGENNLRWHCLPLADLTKSRIPTRRWISRLMWRRSGREGNRAGFLFAKRNGKRASLGDYDPLFKDYIERTMKSHKKLFSSAVAVKDYSLRRSLRRGATTEAENNNVDTVAIELINRWRQKENARGAEAGLSMRQVYTQVSRAVVATLRFSQSH